MREQVLMPAEKAIQHKTGVMVLFTRKTSAQKPVRVFVRSDTKTIGFRVDE